MPEMLGVVPAEIKIEAGKAIEEKVETVEDQAVELEDDKSEKIVDQNNDDQISSVDLEKVERMIGGMVELETLKEEVIETKPELEQMAKKTDQVKEEPRVGKVDQALDVLRRIVGPFNGLYEKAGQEVVQVRALEQTKQEGKAVSLAWGLIKKYSELAAPLYYENAENILETIKRNNFYESVAKESEELLSEAAEDMVYGDWKSVIKKCRQIYTVCKKAINSPEAIQHFAMKQAEEQKREMGKRHRHAENKDKKRQENQERSLRGKSNSKK